MRPDLRERRRETFRLMYRLGLPQRDVIARLADQYDVSEAAVRKDIQRMSGWITEIDVPLHDGVLRVRQVREQVQELEQAALEAKQDGDLAEARRCREAIVSAIQTEDKMARRLGLTDEAPHQVEVIGGLDEADEELLDEWCGLEGDAVDLDEWE